MKKGLTDSVFVLSLIGFVWNSIQESVHSLVNVHTYALLAVVFSAIAATTYFLYEAVTGTSVPPQPPTV